MAKHSGMTFSHWPNDRAKGLCATGHSAKPGNQFSLNCNTKKKKKTAHPGPSQPPPISFPDLFCAEERLHLAAPIAWSLGGWRYGSRPPCPISHVTLALETTNHFRASPAWWMDRLVHHTGCTRVCVCVCVITWYQSVDIDACMIDAAEDENAYLVAFPFCFQPVLTLHPIWSSTWDPHQLIVLMHVLWCLKLQTVKVLQSSCSSNSSTSPANAGSKVCLNLPIHLKIAGTWQQKATDIGYFVQVRLKPA